jgi:hypothetical protein
MKIGAIENLTLGTFNWRATRCFYLIDSSSLLKERASMVVIYVLKID